MLTDVREDELPDLYAWIDSVPLSRPKKNLGRDFADGVCAAEIVAHYFPRLVELHNYSPASSAAAKVANWTTLNQRVFRRLGFSLPRDAVAGAALAEAGAVERVLKLLRARLAAHQAQHGVGRAARLQHDDRGLPAAQGASAAEGGAGRAASPVAFDVGAAPAFAPPAADKFAAGDALLHGEKMQQQQQQLEQRQEGREGLIRAAYDPAAAAAAEAEAEAAELRAVNQLLLLKVSKLEALLRLKDSKVAALEARLQGAHAAG
jgi:hypothetical protein